jgi:hypothetical protein
MTFLRFALFRFAHTCAIALPLLAAGCSSTSSPPPPSAGIQNPQYRFSETNPCAPYAEPPNGHAGCTPRPPRLQVGVSDPDTELILPWFLTDIVNAINTHGSDSDCCMR